MRPFYCMGCSAYLEPDVMKSLPKTTSAVLSAQQMLLTLGLALGLLWLASSCETKSGAIKVPPHLELGQNLVFEGGEPGRAYIVVGYRNELESGTEKTYRGQDYIVFSYINNNHDIKQAVIHQNSIQKK